MKANRISLYGGKFDVPAKKETCGWCLGTGVEAAACSDRLGPCQSCEGSGFYFVPDFDNDCPEILALQRYEAAENEAAQEAQLRRQGIQF